MNFSKMSCIFGLIILISFCGCATIQSEPVSSSVPGIFNENEKALLRPAFINSVNRYLRRYNPQVITQNDDYVKMTAKYDYLLNIELFVRDGEYEITVTTAQERFNARTARKNCDHIAINVDKALTDYLGKRGQVLQ